jgi:ubiquinone/menaquinone biosynthesis C-methylase UbiE
MARIDYEEAARGYDAARGLALEGLEDWRKAVSRWLPGDRPRILDLGAGTGQWSFAFARWFQAKAVAVEPSPAMRKEGVHRTREFRVGWLAGRAESIPLRDASCDAAWLSTVIHHLSDLDASARELRRVVRPGGAVLVRSAFPGRTDRITLFRYFPEAASVVDSYPTIEQTSEAFERAGFQRRELRAVPQVSVGDLASYPQRLSHRSSDTVLRLMDDDVYARGLERLERDIAAGMETGPLVDELDLLVFA